MILWRGFAKTLETASPNLICEKMEHVWEELKKIEAQAQQIRSEAQTRSKQITDYADKQAEQLVEHAKAYAEQDAQTQNDTLMKQANQKHDQQLQASQQTIAEVQTQAQKRLSESVDLIVKSVLGEKYVAPDNKIR